ncbi:flagellar biosynthesis anti-sigma factor FlgM [Sansalvadorimonas sp. 2012CJ34-2]|uniref:Negative regulator of flagellin synthesis n=1 Tax=Parendozoicomonas callyspongiae TaxID=2942213 RepID=A0ABT0PFF6_9GAMM|nr:flagellar biosynthesis anti-sigma factor FlgM [Sansalvadorimonas sp. 2012CJ34-2]MCL6270108.1 flagellar biosynthesis anti-sigma factor FlgM [Sansalvadorimonas sp. 2012CJ34-2]
MAPTRITGSVSDFTIERMRRSETGKVANNKISGSDKDKLSISTDAATLQNAEALAKSAPDVDMDKVGEIKQAIINGELKIDYEKLAQKMLDFEAEIGDILGDE